MTNIYDFLGYTGQKIEKRKDFDASRIGEIRKRADNIVKKYFHVNVDQTNILLRRPPGEIADPIRVISSDYTKIHSRLSSLFALQYLKGEVIKQHDPNLENVNSCNKLIQMVGMKDYSKIMTFAKLLILKSPKMIIAPYFGYMAAICAQSREEELFFVKAIEKTPLPKQDYPHFIHLLDEIRSLEMNPDVSPLLVKLIYFDSKEMSKVMSGGYRIVPGYYQYMMGNNGVNSSSEALSVIKDNALNNLPILKFAKDKNEETNEEEEECELEDDVE